MRTEAELAAQLRTYGEWLEGRTPAPRQATATTIVEVDIDVDDVESRPASHRRSLRWLVAASLVLVAATAAALALTSRRDEGPADAPTRRPVPLYVVPDADAPVVNPSVLDGVARPADGLVVGTPTGSGFDEPVTVTVTDAAPSRVGGSWQDLSLDTGPAIIDEAVSGVRIFQEREGRWIVVLAPAGQSARARDVLEHVELDADGAPHLAADSADSTVASFHSDLAGLARSTYFELPDGVVVETAPGVHPLAVPLLGERIEPETLGDRPAWHLTNDQIDGTQHALVWMGGPDQLVAVSGTTDYGNVLDAARSLTTVDLDTWRARVGPLSD